MSRAEDSFILAVAARNGSIEVTRGTEVETITSTDRDERPFLFLERDDSPVVRVLNRNGKVSPCVAEGTGDMRGRIGAFTIAEPPMYPDPAAFRELDPQPCDESAPWPYEVPEPAIARACIETDFGDFILVHAETSEELMEPPQPGLECLVTLKGNSASNACWNTATASGEVDRSSNRRHSWLSAVAPEDATRIVAMSSTGTELVSIPHQRIGFVWWHHYEGDLLTVIAEAPSGDVVLYPEEDEVGRRSDDGSIAIRRRSISREGGDQGEPATPIR